MFLSLSQWILGVFADQGAIDWNVRFAFDCVAKVVLHR
jgi:hypothetical protein